MTCGHMRSRNKLNTLHLHLQKTYRHQTMQGTDLLWEAPTIKVTWSFDHVTDLRPHDKVKKIYTHFQKTYGH